MMGRTQRASCRGAEAAPACAVHAGGRPRGAARRARACSILLALIGSLAAASSAPAASTLTVSGEIVSLTDTIGERNDVTVNHGNNPGAVANLNDQAGVTPVAPCLEYVGNFACPTPVRPTFVLDLGTGDDFAQVINSAAEGTHSELRGGPGDDQLWSFDGSDTLDGGPGDDELKPDDDHPSPGDVVRGGPGIDHLQLAPAVSSEVVAILDDQPNDGQPGHGDDYAADIENVTGAQTARNTIVGTVARNILTGQGQSDRLTGAGGRDVLDGDEGSDTLDALDGAGGDRLTCGGGADVAWADRGDVVAEECEQTTWAPGLASTRLRYRDKRVRVTLACPAQRNANCRGTLRLTTTNGNRLATASYRARHGTTTTVSLRVARKPARAATLTIAPRGTRPLVGRAVRIR